MSIQCHLLKKKGEEKPDQTRLLWVYPAESWKHSRMEPVQSLWKLVPTTWLPVASGVILSRLFFGYELEDKSDLFDFSIAKQSDEIVMKK